MKEGERFKNVFVALLTGVMRPSGIEPDPPRWQRDVLTDILWPLPSSSFLIFINLFREDSVSILVGRSSEQVSFLKFKL